MTSTTPDFNQPSGAPSGEPAVRPRDFGASFLELLVAIVLLGTAGVAVLASMSAATVGARASDEVADVQSLLAEASVVVGDTYPELVPYVSCDAGTDVVASYQTSVDTWLAGSLRGEVTVAAVRFWNGTDFGAGCFYGGSADGGTNCGHRLQEVELRASVGDSTRTARIVKRPLAPPTACLGPIPPPPPGGYQPGELEVELTPGING